MTNPFDQIFQDLQDIKSKLEKPFASPIIPPAEIISRDELCKRLGITEPTSIRWGKKNVIPYFRIGSSIRYNWPKVIEALEGKKKGGAK